MAGGGSKPGQRRGGRQKGTPNKRTAERRLREVVVRKTAKMTGADAKVLQKAVNKVLDSRTLAVDELASMMPVVRQIVEYHQTAPFAAANAGRFASPGQWHALKDWLELFLRWCDTLAAYQSPKLRGIAVHQVGSPVGGKPLETEPPAGAAKESESEAVTATEASRIYRRMLKAS
jgi:hypothetical protein